MQNIRVELIDILHFLVSAMMCAGLSAEKVFDIYRQKHAINIKRQDTEYNKKISVIMKYWLFEVWFHPPRPLPSSVLR